MSALPTLADLRARLVDRSVVCRELADDPKFPALRTRREGKADGLLLAVSFVDEYLRGAWDHLPDSPAPVDEDALLRRITEVVSRGRAAFLRNDTVGLTVMAVLREAGVLPEVKP